MSCGALTQAVGDTIGGKKSLQITSMQLYFHGKCSTKYLQLIADEPQLQILTIETQYKKAKIFGLQITISCFDQTLIKKIEIL